MKSQFTSVLIFLMLLCSKFSFTTVQGIGRFLGRTFLKHDKRTVNAIDINLKLCWPDKSDEERYKIRNARLEHMGQTLLELSHLWVKESAELLPYLQPAYDNSVFEETMRTEQGVIFLAPHLGNWEIINSYLAQFRTPTFMYRPQKKSDKLDRFIRKSRERIGAELAPANLKGVTQLIKALKRGGLVGILPDQVPQEGGGVYAPFYGHQAYTMTLAHKLAQKTNAKVFIGSAFRIKGGYELLIEPIDEEFYSENLEISATYLNQSIENIISYHPEQYQWEYKRFKKQVDKKKRIYPRG